MKIEFLADYDQIVESLYALSNSGSLLIYEISNKVQENHSTNGAYFTVEKYTTIIITVLNPINVFQWLNYQIKVGNIVT